MSIYPLMHLLLKFIDSLWTMLVCFFLFNPKKNRIMSFGTASHCRSERHILNNVVRFTGFCLSMNFSRINHIFNDTALNIFFQVNIINFCNPLKSCLPVDYLLNYHERAFVLPCESFVI